jgi:metallo-beta-lactamase class B
MNRNVFLHQIVILAGMAFSAGCAVQPPQTTPTTTIESPIAIGPETDFAHIDLGEGLYLRQIRADAFVVTHAFPWPANSLILEMENSDLVLAGTPYTPEAMETVLEWIRGHFGERNIVAINPGYHGEQTRQMLLGMLPGAANERYYKAHAEIPYVAPDHLFPIDQGLILTFGTEQVEVYYPGPTQAPDKVVIYFPAKKILFGSCMVLGGDKAGNIHEADMANWPKAIEKLKRFNVDFVVPGHGDRLDPGLIDHTISILESTP